ncbi:MAG TPA: hypothetical protein VHO25_04990, partial [Polyangiaceae bacterium]|nr:hypothetical protein [Polyangiaceae bacterium]
MACRVSWVLLSVCCAAVSAACSSSTSDNSNTVASAGSPSGNLGGSGGTGGTTTAVGGAGSGGQAIAGSAGTAGGAAGAAGGTAGAGGAVGGAGGASGGTGGAAGGTAGAGGTLPVGCEMLGSPGKTGIQCDPGIEGDGTFEQMQPAEGIPPEAMGEPQGTLFPQETYDSTIFGYGFNYRIYVPAQYEAGKPAALMIFQDGELYYNEMNGNSIFDVLIAAGEMPVTISVHIQPGDNRGVEYD